MTRKKTVDRRLVRTRSQLQHALLSLIVEKGYEATTVQDIIDRANVGRSTFYAHFADKETLLLSGIEDLRAFLKEQQAHAHATSGEPHERGFGFSLAMLEHAKSHWQLFQAMVGRKSGSVVLQRIRDMLADLVRDDLAALGYKAAPARRDLMAQFVTGAFMGVIAWWLDHGAKLSAQEVDLAFHELVMDGFGAALEQQEQGRRRN